MEAAHLLPAADVLRHFSVTVESGLRPEQVSDARERYGPNGESAGLAGEARGRTRRGLSLLSYSDTGERSSPLTAFGSPEAGRKRELRKLLQMPLGRSEGLCGHLRGRLGGFRV